MKGKIVDRDFLNNFINECLENGVSSSQEMACLARQQIESIDSKIKEVEELKTLRCKLLDVVYSFEKEKLTRLNNDSKRLLFYRISNANISETICTMMIESDYELSLKSLEDNIKKAKHDVCFCIKQMIEIGVLNRSRNVLTKGSLFDEYFEFIWKR